MADYSAAIACQERMIVKLETEKKELKTKVKDLDAKYILTLEMWNKELLERVKNLECTASTLLKLLERALYVNSAENGGEDSVVVAEDRSWPAEISNQPCVGGSAEYSNVLAPVATAAVPATVPLAIPSTSGANQMLPSDIGIDIGSVDASVPYAGCTGNLPSVFIRVAREHSKALYDASVVGNFDRVLYLLRTGAKVNYKYKGSSGLHEAAARNYSNILSTLIACGARVNVQNNDGDTPLHIAASYGRRKCIEMLVDAGALVNVRNSDASTPLHLASSTGTYACVRSLLDAGADAGLANKMHQFPKDLAHTTGIRCLFRN